jgi:hypothetical protein
MRKEFKPRTMSCRNGRGEIISIIKDVPNRWKQYFKEMLDGTDEEEETSNDDHLSTQLVRANNKEGDSEENRTPTKEEVQNAIRKLSNNRSPGLDNINVGFIKANVSELIETIYNIMHKVCITEELPHEWEKGALCPVHKKGDQLECKNYR